VVAVPIGLGHTPQEKTKKKVRSKLIVVVKIIFALYSFSVVCPLLLV
jgi:hypothetical protein